MPVKRSVIRKKNEDECSRRRSKTLEDSEMPVIRYVTRKKKNEEECSRKRSKTLEDSGPSPLSHLIDDLLFLVILRLGVADFVSFSHVCKRWRSLALFSRKMFMATRQPMSLSFSTFAYKKSCYLEDLEHRKIKTILPHSTGRTCVGSTCGYLIFYGTKAYDFWLVNPITRHELHFPRYYTDPEKIRGILVFSPSVSGWVFVVSHSRGLSHGVSFCLAGKEEACWNHVWFDYPIEDLHFFKGKIYTITSGGQLYEVRLNAKPALKLLLGDDDDDNILISSLLLPEFASRGENLYVFGYTSDDLYVAMEMDFDQMKLVWPGKTMEKYVCFVDEWKSGAAGKVGIWADPCEQYEKFGYFHGNDKVSREGLLFAPNMWYFPHDCLIVNYLQE